MKKIYMILSALALTVAMNAQQLAHFAQRPFVSKGEVQRVVFNKPAQICGYANSTLPLKFNQAEERDTTIFGEYEIINQLYMGSDLPGLNTPFLMVPYSDTVYYYSDYGKGDWKYEAEDEEAEKTIIVQVSDTDVLAYPTPSYGWSYCNPTLSLEPTQITTSKGVTYNVTFKDYMYGYGIEAYAPGQGLTPTNLMVGYWEPEPLTTCLLVTPDASSTDAADNLVWLAWDDNCHYVYGTGLEDQKNFGKGTVDSMGTMIPVPEGKSIWIDTVFVHCVTESGSLENAIPDDAELTLTLYPVVFKENPQTGELTQYILNDSIVAQAKATKKVCTTGGGNTFTIPFVFMGKNVFGIDDVQPIVITQRCYAEITGYNESKCDFGVLCDYAEHASSGSTFILKNGKYYNFGLNMDVAFKGYFPDIHMWDDTWIEEVPMEGGYVQMGFLDEYGEEDSSDELEFACNISTGFDDDADLYDANGEVINLKTDPVIKKYEILGGPETYEEGGEEWISLSCQISIEVQPNNTGADREYTVYLQAYGAKMPIVIKQKGDGTGFKKIKAVNDNKVYNVFGVEVDKTYEGVVIRNGIKSIQ